MPIDWTDCPAIRTKPGYLSGAPALRDDPRIPAETVIDNMDAGLTAEEVVELFALQSSPTDIRAIFDFAKEQRLAHSV